MSRAKTRVSDDPESTETGEATGDEAQRSTIPVPGKKRVRKTRPVEDRKRCTIELTHKLAWILTEIADKRGLDKYDLIFNVLESGAKRYDEFEACDRYYSETRSQAVRVA